MMSEYDVKIDGMTAGEYQADIDQMVSRHGDRVPTEIITVPGSRDRAYVLRSNHRDADSRNVLCAWRGKWVSWVQSYETGRLDWGRYTHDAESAHQERTARTL